jgi:hypothetical protein
VVDDIAQRLRAQLGVRIGAEVVAPGGLDGDTGRLTQSKPRRFEDRRDRS